MPQEWRRSVLIPIYKNKGDAQCCGNYRGIKLVNDTMKVWERFIFKGRVEISKHQYGFMPGKGTTDAMFALKSSLYRLQFKKIVGRRALRDNSTGVLAEKKLGQ